MDPLLNCHRPHSACGNQPPIIRVTNLSGQHNETSHELDLAARGSGLGDHHADAEVVVAQCHFFQVFDALDARREHFAGDLV